MNVITYKLATSQFMTTTWSSSFGMSKSSILSLELSNMPRKRLQYYMQTLSNVVELYKQCLIPPNQDAFIQKGKLELSVLILDLGQYHIRINQTTYGWTSITIPKLFAVKELYFLVVTPFGQEIAFNPTITKGGWLTGTFSYNNQFISDNIHSTGVFASLTLYPFIPFKFPQYFIYPQAIIDENVHFEMNKNDYGSIRILKQCDNMYLGLIQNLVWKKQPLNADGLESQTIFRASFAGKWPCPLPENTAIRFCNNTRFVSGDLEFNVNLEKFLISNNKDFVIGSLASALCEPLSKTLTARELPQYAITQFEIVFIHSDLTHILFSCNPKLFFTGDILSFSPRYLHIPNLYEITVYAPYDIHFYPNGYHTVILPISYATEETKEILIAGIKNEGFFETELSVWPQNTLLYISLRSFSPNFILIQGSPIATLFFVQKMSTAIQNIPTARSFSIQNKTFIGNLMLTEENFLHYDDL